MISADLNKKEYKSECSYVMYRITGKRLWQKKMAREMTAV